MGASLEGLVLETPGMGSAPQAQASASAQPPLETQRNYRFVSENCFSSSIDRQARGAASLMESDHRQSEETPGSPLPRDATALDLSCEQGGEATVAALPWGGLFLEMGCVFSPNASFLEPLQSVKSRGARVRDGGRGEGPRRETGAGRKGHEGPPPGILQTVPEPRTQVVCMSLTCLSTPTCQGAGGQG